ncbi:hypothetical protein E8E11_000696 [Didymella keratinophila]|nr:hypothetical protein E8E11_000696 [Didymella keratinophila]
MADSVANTSVKQRSAKPARSFLTFPPELRIHIHKLYIGEDIVDYVPNWAVFSRHCYLSLAQICKQIYQEFISFFRSDTTVRVRHYHLERYLKTFYPIAVTANGTYGAARLHVLLPHNLERPQTPPVPYFDLTSLFVLMAYYDMFKCTFGYTSPPDQEPHEIALSEAKELTSLLSRTSRSAASILASIIEVRLVMRQAGYNNKKPPTVDEANVRPAVWFLLKEHTVLPGDWPWYGAHDRNAESLLLWQQWLKRNGVSDLERWHVYVTVHREGSQLIDETVIPADNARFHYKAVSPEKHQDYMLATRLRRWRF